MHPLFQIGYRFAAIALCIHNANVVWYGLIEKKISLFNSNILDFRTPSERVFHRDATPIRYWIVLAMKAGTAAVCLVAAIVGWWQPNG